MTITAADLTTAFPEFADTSKYPTAQVNFWIPQAYQQLSARRFGQSLDLAAMLFVAHNIVLSARNAQAAASPAGVVGASTGLLTSKAVGPVSAGYDVGTASYEGAGIWNATSYGQRLWQMMKAFTTPMYVAGRQPVTSPFGVGWRR